MPQGKGTYGSKVGRPTKKKKYNIGGKLKGNSHNDGGIQIEAEGGEYIIKKDSVNPKTEPILDYINKNGDIPLLNAKERSKNIYMGGGKVKYSYKDGGKISDIDKKKLKQHSAHHSKKHMNEMKKDMNKGSSFKKAHNKAMNKVGK